MRIVVLLDIVFVVLLANGINYGKNVDDTHNVAVLESNTDFHAVYEESAERGISRFKFRCHVCRFVIFDRKPLLKLIVFSDSSSNNFLYLFSSDILSHLFFT